MHKKLLVLFVLLCMVLVACTPKATPAAPVAPEPAVQATDAPAAPAPTEAAPVAPAATEAAPAASSEEVTLSMGSWRVDDTAQMGQILDAFHAKYPNITIKFDPTNPPDYNAVLRTQLEGGTAPDLYYLRSYATSLQLYNEGFLDSLADLPGLKENFSEASRAPWATEDGTPYGIPFIAVSHGVYYNQAIFNELGLQIPTTWQQFIADAQTIKDAGYTPIANGSGDEWTIAEIVFMNLAPNFIGGREGRLAYLSGDRCFNDSNAVAAFQGIKDIAPFLPDGQAALTYYDSQQLFLMGEAAMWLGGSWDIPFFETEAPDFEWGVFAVPAPEGQPGYITFHMDAGMGVNAASTHKEEAKLFLEWMTSEEFAKMFGDLMPGFFPVRDNPPALNDPHANEFLALNQGRGQDVRWAWPVLMDGAPDGYTLMQNGAISVIKDEMTPQQAADALQEGLAQWLDAAKNCKQ